MCIFNDTGNCECDCGCSNSCCRKSLTVRSTTGKLYLLRSTVGSEAYIIFFNVDIKLTLNITFLLLKFYSDLHYCESSGIKIIKTKYQNRSHSQNHNEVQYIYCKQYATFNFYPKFNQLYIITIRDNQNFILPFQLGSKYSVTDSNFITTKESKIQLYDPNLTNFVFHNFWFNGKYLLVSYHIKVKKIYQVVISSNINYFSVFDGPGFTFKKISVTNNQYTTSTFQCIVQDFKELNQLKQTEYYLYVAKQLRISRHILITNKTLSFQSSGKCRNHVCIIRVSAGFKYQVNFTIKSFSSMSSMDSGCLFFGLVVLEDNTFEESETICKHLYHSLSPSRSFYSFNSSLLIVTYKYKYALNSSFSGLISRTQCQPIHFDPCLLKYYFCNSLTNFNLTNIYISSLAKSSNINLSLNNNNLIPISFHYYNICIYWFI